MNNEPCAYLKSLGENIVKNLKKAGENWPLPMCAIIIRKNLEIV